MKNKNSKKNKIGLIGMENFKVNFLKKKYKNSIFYSLNRENIEKFYDLNSIIVFTESGFSDWIDNFFYKKKYKLYKNLSWFHLSRAGLDDYANETKKINFLLTCGKIIQGPNVSEQCIAILLYLSRRLNHINNIKALLKNRPIELYKKNALVFGFGGIGTQIVKKLIAFGMNVSVAERKFISSDFDIKNFYINKKIEKIINQYDVVICAASLNEGTKYFFNKKIFSKMKKNSIFINVSRGQCVNTKDLAFYLKKDKFLGVGLDVIDPEPLPKNHPIRKFPKFYYTNHTAGWSDTLERRFNLIIDNIYRFEKKKPLLNIYDSY